MPVAPGGPASVHSAIARILSSKFRRFFCKFFERSRGWGRKERFPGKLKRVSGPAPVERGAGAPRDAPPGLIKPRSRPKVNKPGGVWLRPRVQEDEGGEEGSRLQGAGEKKMPGDLGAQGGSRAPRAAQPEREPAASRVCAPRGHPTEAAADLKIPRVPPAGPGLVDSPHPAEVQQRERKVTFCCL